MSTVPRGIAALKWNVHATGGTGGSKVKTVGSVFRFRSGGDSLMYKDTRVADGELLDPAFERDTCCTAGGDGPALNIMTREEQLARKVSRSSDIDTHLLVQQRQSTTTLPPPPPPMPPALLVYGSNPPPAPPPPPPPPPPPI